MIRCLIVDDSPSFRAVLRQALARVPEVEVVGEAADGAEAVEHAVKLRPDVITIDVQMPRQNGVEAIAQIMERAPAPIVVIGSTAADPAVSFQALALGAVEVLAKPSAADPALHEKQLEQIRTAVRVLSGVKVITQQRLPRPGQPAALAPRPPLACVGIVTSTGGPAALEQLLHKLPGTFSAPILVVQHVQPGFLHGLARWLGQHTPLTVKVAEHDEPLRAGTVYLAPDGAHLLASRGRARLEATAPVRGFCPSGTVLLASIAKEYGAGAAGLVLTGMGDDGVAGLKLLRGRGGSTIAQGEASSVVYGMPRAAIESQAAETIAELDQLPELLVRLAGGAREQKQKRLLLVDDTETILAMEQKLFGGDYELCVARNGKEALEAAERFRPHAILMDYSMPVMTGGQALKEMRTRTVTRDIPVVMVTSETDPALLASCWEGGCHAIVKKPIDALHLQQTVRRLVPPATSEIP